MNFKLKSLVDLGDIKHYSTSKNAHINYIHDEGEYGPPNYNNLETYNKINKDQKHFVQKLGTNLQDAFSNLNGLDSKYIQKLKDVSDYKQDNPNLKNIPLGNFTMGNSGCMISSLMGIYYLYTGKTIDVTKFIKDVMRDKLWNMQTCGDADVFSKEVTFAITTNWGLSAKPIKATNIVSVLQSGQKILVNVNKESPMGSGGPLGHYFVLDHINPATGEIYIYNPNSKYEGYVTMEFLEANVLPYLNTEVRSSLWSINYNPNHKAMSQSVSANKYNAPDFNYEKLGLNALEIMHQTSANAPVSANIPAVDLGATSFKTVENFNQYIKDNVNAAGYGTRNGVIAAGLSLISGYNFATGKRLRYSQPERQVNAETNNIDAEGIVNADFYLDCSSFAWWALYTGGFKTPLFSSGNNTQAYTGDQINWAKETGSLKPFEEGRAGDFLIRHVTQANAHIVMIVGKDETGYYCAEFSSPDNGAQITKKTFTDLNNNGYNLIDMDAYYSNSNNVR